MNLAQISVLLSRVALFVIYFWFGLLKVVGQSPASDMVHHLLNLTMPFMSFGLFIVFFGLFEMVIGILFIIPNLEKYALTLFGIHMFTTVLPLFVMSEVWSHVFVPTLEGQYIVKNLALVACAVTIWASLNSTQITNERE